MTMIRELTLLSFIMVMSKIRIARLVTKLITRGDGDTHNNRDDDNATT